MKTNFPVRTALFGLLATTLVACGGGGGGGGPSDVAPYNPADPFVGPTSLNTLEQTVGAQDGREMAAQSASVIGFSGASDLENGARVRPMGLTLNGNFDSTSNQRVEWNINDGARVGGTDFDPDDPTTGPTYSEGLLSGANAPEGMFIGREANGDSQQVVYIPAGELSGMRGAMVAVTERLNSIQSPDNAAFGIFGTRTQDPSALTGTASYSGVAAAYVYDAVDDPTQARSGFFEGTAIGDVDFGNGTVDTEAALSGQGQTLTITTEATISGAGVGGTISGTLGRAGSLGGQAISGTTEGTFLGPNGETLGMTFIGEDGQDLFVSGGQILNRD